jgi:hypothetical protein
MERALQKLSPVEKERRISRKDSENLLAHDELP